MNLRNEVAEMLRAFNLEPNKVPHLIDKIVGIAEQHADDSTIEKIKELYEEVKEADGDEWEIHTAFCDAMDVEYSYGEEEDED